MAIDAIHSSLTVGTAADVLWNGDMADQIQCQGCKARFRVRLRPNAPLQADLACPRCGSTIALRRSPQKPEPKTQPKTQPKTPEPIRREKPDSGWHAIEHSAVFGRPTRPPPGAKPTSSSAPPTSQKEREDIRPLANALLEKIKTRRSETPGEQTETASSSVAKPASPTTEKTTVAEPVFTNDPWIDDELIEETATAATTELLVVQSDPVPFDRLRGPDAHAPTQAEAKESEPSPGQPEAPPPPPPIPQDTEESPTETAERPDFTAKPEASQPADEPFTTPLTVDIGGGDETDDRPPLAEEFSGSETAYRLRIGDRVYGDIGFDGLISLFRRGVWVIADEIAVGDGPWMPIESHPIFERVRYAIADGMSNLLSTHARLIDEQIVDEQSEPVQTKQAQTEQAKTEQVQSAEEKSPEPDVEADLPVPSPELTEPNQPTGTRVGLSWSAGVAAAACAGVAVATAFFLIDPLSWSTGDDASSTTAPPAHVDDEELTDKEHKELQQKWQSQLADAIESATGHIASAATLDATALAERAIQRGEYDRARAIATRHHSADANADELHRVYLRAIEEDPDLHQYVRTIEPSQDVDLLRALGGGGSITFRFIEEGENRYAYKVARDEWEDGWRVEVAAYLLGKILSADLYVPYNEPARVSRQDFDELYGRLDTPRQRSYAAQRFDEKFWVEEEGPDGVEREYLYGTLKEWIPQYTNWPIEHTDPWQPWLDLSHPEEILDEDFEDYLERLAAHDRSAADGLRDEMQGHTTRDAARRLSNLHVFDYLTSNFDRYSGIEAYYGVNSHFADGRFVPIDNSTAFALVEYPVVHRRLMRVQRFSRSLIDAVRMLQPDTVDPILFPDRTHPDIRRRDQTRLDLFWEQRERLLAYVDDLVEEYGEEAIYVFD